MFTTASPDFLSDPYAAYELVRGPGGVMWLPGIFGSGAWVVTSHAICTSVLRDKHFGKEGEKVLSPEKFAVFTRQGAEAVQRRTRSMLFRDPPDHTRLRSLVSKAFTPRTVEGLRPRVVEITERLIDGVESAGQMDLIEEVAFPLPITVIAELLGVPPEDRDRFKAWSVVITLGLNPQASPEVLARASVAIDALDDYLMGVIEERRRAPRADLISELVRAHEGSDKLSMDELISTCRLILTAGHETTVNLIGNGMLALLRHPEQRAILAADPSLLPGAIEEFLRYDSPVQMTTRFTYEASALGDQTCKPGDLVVLILAAGNRDPATFKAPRELDVRRDNAHANLAFGGGVHYCLGAPLARLEAEIAMGALLRRLPGLALAKQDLVWRENVVLRGLHRLVVAF